jgi:hypothetical protein
MLRSEEALPKFNVSKTIGLGVYKDTDAYRKALKKKSINISRWADDALGKIDVAAVEVEVDVVKILRTHLGFTTAARCDSIHRRTFSIGFEPCMPEIGPRLREEYMDQPPVPQCRHRPSPSRSTLGEARDRCPTASAQERSANRRAPQR